MGELRVNVAYLVLSLWYHCKYYILGLFIRLGDWTWSGVYGCVFIFLNWSLSSKIQDIGVVSFVRNHVVSDHCEAITWNGKAHATLLILCVFNVTNIYFYQVTVKLYHKHTSIFIFSISKSYKNNRNKKV